MSSKNNKTKAVCHYVYIVECADSTFYTGYTKDVKRRLFAHNNLPSGARYTKARRPVILRYSEKCVTRGEALQKEYALKQLTRNDKLQLILKSKSVKKF